MRTMLALLATSVAWAGSTAWDQPGPHEVKSAEHPDLVDEARDGRSVPLKAFYPADGKDLPIVVISHGGGGKWDSSSEQARHLASHGYLVVCPTHVDSSNERIRHYMSKAGGRMDFRHALHQITIDRAAVLERPHDIRFAIDQAVRWNEAGDLEGRIDTMKVALMGHSFGAFTTLVVCGARPTYDDLVPHVEPKTGLAPDLSDPRVVFGLAMSPQSPEGCFFGEESYQTIDRPLICLSGSKDEQKGADGGTLPAETRRRAWELMPAGKKWLLWLENVDHLAFSYNPDASIQLPSPAREDAQRISRAVMLLSCEVFLRGNEAAKADFNSDYVSTLCGKVVTKIEWSEK